MFKFSLAILLVSSVGADCWKPIILNAKLSYIVKNEGKMFKPFYSENEEKINAGLVIDGDTAKTIKMGYSYPFAMADTVRIDLFDTELSYAHTFSIIILKDRYLIRYSREINHTEFVQKFESLKSKLELNTSDFSNGSKVRGRVEYIGKCVSGCTDNSKKIRIEGNFAVKMSRY